LPELGRLLELIDPMPAYRRLIEGLEERRGGTVVVLEAARPYFAAALYEYLRLPVLIITAQPENARKLQEQLSDWCLSGPARLFPEPDVLPYERLTPDALTEMERVRVLAALAVSDLNGDGDRPPLVVASVAALVSKTTSRRDFIAACHTVALGMTREPLRWLGQLEAMGYRLENVVEVPGAMSHRGGIVDVWPPTSDFPVRLEFFGDTIDSIRRFDPSTQRSTEKLSSVPVVPATELLAPRRLDKRSLEEILQALDLRSCAAEARQRFQQDIAMFLGGQVPTESQLYAALLNRGSLLDFLPPGTLIVLDETSSIESVAAELDAEAAQLRSDKIGRGELPPNFPRPYFTWDELESGIGDFHSLNLAAWGVEEPMDFISAPGYAGKLPLFLKKTVELLAQRKRVIVVSHQASRLSELFTGEDIIAAPVEKITDVPGPGALLLVQGSLPEGWVMSGDTCLFTDSEIFGFVKQRRLLKKRPVPRQKLMVDIIPDDFVVHIEHGIGKFTGVTTLKAAGNEKEYLVLQYAAGDTLYVPTDQIDRVNRYVGAGDRPPVLSRLGTQEWVRTRQKAKEAAELLARDLLALYATREVVPGFAFSRDTLWQQELESAFPYVETPDQLEALQEVKSVAMSATAKPR
jgi:transcription-repair coupling factor (superfamily II helicase)